MAKNELTLEELAKQIYQGAGGMGNVESIVHCMTRVRMSGKMEKQFLSMIGVKD